MHKRSAFTLVELLVVIAIIGMLASLITAAAVSAFQYVKVGRIKIEIHQFEMAIEQYKNEFGDYPPDFFDNEALVRHVKKRWPRFVFNSSATNTTQQAAHVRQAMANVYANTNYYTNDVLKDFGIDTAAGLTIAFETTAGTIDDSARLGSLIFWLGGFPNAEGKFTGFSADPQAPFGRYVSNSSVNDGNTASSAQGAPDKKVFCELQIGKNVVFAKLNTIVFPCLVQKASSDMFVPYVYFRGKTNGGTSAYLFNDGTNDVPKYIDFSQFANTPWANIDTAVPYALSGGDPFAGTNPTQVAWYNSEKFQLIHPGLDGNFGGISSANVATSPFDSNYFKTTGTLTGSSVNCENIGQKDMDNIVNFGEGTIKASLP